ncbi:MULTISPECIES: SpoIIE family protein phosphatase [Nocardiopsis]|uniref:PAS/PAC sensor protein n=3 Tax=Nocardiopsis TaxID=2013 RepID=D7AV11_NOCDD|nr:SpoIIE family protein phosphatase [Nocardiopsis dassonvillei]ADH69561.1 putative PAS/PAC sensor protein [Nocardiopsis dassonvillei subsp. dassonvillei DSM 43111]APC37563.1 histidine kinase [Nocardiopsis dassonvillei]NKY79078.1 SpoIIE family protein phosphatase [Nocardiopsis dassonvillei]VEI90071.1 Phosphoserine phosphatase rsbU [Nocardiopsis dassonvillei]
MTRWGEPFPKGDALAAAAVADQAQIAIVVIDRASLLRYWNPFARELFGFVGGRDYVGLSLLDIGIHESDREHASQLARRVLRGEPWEGTFAVLRGDSTWIHVRAQAVPMHNEAGEIDGITLIAREALRSGRVEEQYGLLERIGSRLTSSLEFDSTVRGVAGILVPQFADHCFIDLYDRDRLVRQVSVHAEGWTPPPRTWFEVGDEVRYPERHFVTQALRRLETVVSSEYLFENSPSTRSDQVSRQVGVTSAIAAPLRARGEVLGVLTLALSGLSPRQKSTYGGFDRDLVGAIASRVALAIDNARLFEQERSTALAFQRSLLPSSLPRLDGLTAAHRYLPAGPLRSDGYGVQTQIGGDFYDAIPLSAGRVGLVIGDVEGRGPHAAAVMGQLRAALRAFAQADREPADILRELDEWVRQLGQEDEEGGTWIPSVSCLYMVYDAWSRELSYANAGHAPPLLVTSESVEKIDLEVTDRMLGVRAKGGSGEDVVYHQANLRLPIGATLVLYTDGLVDRRPAGGRADPESAFELLAERVAEVADKDVDQIAEAAVHSVPGEHDDDTALLVVRTHSEELALREGWFPSEASTVGEARHMAAHTFSEWGVDRDQAELACLLVSEIVTNVVIHATPHPVHREFTGGGVLDSETPLDAVADEFDEDWTDLLEAVAEEADEPAEEAGEKEFLLRLRRGANTVWVEVFDNDLRLPRIRSAAADDEGGRGLYLVEQLASRWGARPTPDGKAVWFEMPMHSEETGEQHRADDGEKAGRD